MSVHIVTCRTNLAGYQFETRQVCRSRVEVDTIKTALEREGMRVEVREYFGSDASLIHTRGNTDPETYCPVCGQDRHYPVGYEPPIGSKNVRDCPRCGRTVAGVIRVDGMLVPADWLEWPD